MTRSELKKIIADGETVHLECKLAKNAIPAGATTFFCKNFKNSLDLRLILWYYIEYEN
jgi:hypothetical protein